MRRFVAIVAGASLLPQTAFARPGDHVRMSGLELMQHYAEPDHLAFLALSVIVGIAAYRWGRCIEARARLAAQRRKEPDA